MTSGSLPLWALAGLNASFQQMSKGLTGPWPSTVGLDPDGKTVSVQAPEMEKPRNVPAIVLQLSQAKATPLHAVWSSPRRHVATVAMSLVTTARSGTFGRRARLRLRRSRRFHVPAAAQSAQNISITD